MEFNLNTRLKLPKNVVKKIKRDKVLFLNPEAPDWIVVSKNGAAILQLCNGKRSIRDIANALSQFGRDNFKEEIFGFFSEILSKTTFFSEIIDDHLYYQPYPLRIVQLSLVNSCNLKCIYCYASDRPTSTDKLNREDHFNLVESIQSISKSVNIVITGGEPLLSPYAIELAEYAKALGNQVQLLTNGTLITKQNAKRISDVFNLVKVSIDGSCSKIHDFHRGNGNFNKAMQGIELLQNNGAPVQVAMTVTKQNINDIGAMVQKYGSMLTFAPLFNAGRAKNHKGLGITGKQYYKALSSVDGVRPLNRLCSTLAVAKNKRIMKCAVGDGEISISENGDVFPCQLLHFNEFRAGNVKNRSLKHIYESSDVLNYCRELTVLNIPKCRKCDIRFICGGACRARAFYEVGNLSANGTFCEYEKSAFIDGLFELYEI